MEHFYAEQLSNLSTSTPKKLDKPTTENFSTYYLKDSEVTMKS